MTPWDPFLHILAQVVLTLYLWDLAARRWDPAAVCKTDAMLQLVCVLVFLAAVMSSLEPVLRHGHMLLFAKHVIGQ